MKSSEIATIILIVFISGVASFFLVNTLWGNPSEKTKDIQVMEEISDNFAEPSSEIFNKNSINPTVQVVIGEGEGKITYGNEKK
ncbi:MAG: hypothetical protein Q4A21_00350 [bacterium]|nr:hypothetical protein [bacterium]